MVWPCRPMVVRHTWTMDIVVRFQAVPARIRGAKGDGDAVTVALAFHLPD